MRRETVEGYIRAQFEEAEDSQIKAIVNSVMSDNGKDINHYKSELEEKEAELTSLREIKAEYEQYKKSTMSEEEKRQADIEEAKKLRHDLTVKSNKMDIERMFVSEGIEKEDYQGIIDSIVSEDLNASMASAEQMLNLIKKTKENTEKTVRSDVLKQTPIPQGGTKQGNSVTKEQFDSMSYAERLQVFNESPEVYEQLTQGD